jgi:hypothetical protein
VTPIILNDTPIEEYEGIHVKREDLSAPPGAPPFSKIRGLVRHLEKLKKQGFIGAAYVETSVSMAGWGVAWACAHLNMKCLIFNPVYKKPIPLLEFHRGQWNRWGAELIDIPAGRAKVNYYSARKRIPKKYKLLPLGLPLLETLEETSRIAKASIQDFPTIVTCTGSGTITAGVWQATRPGQTVYGILCRTGDLNLKKKRIVHNPLSLLPSFQPQRGGLQLGDEGWEYSQPSKVEVPFPCHPWYDAKAWEWLVKNKDKLEKPVLFWNIGSTGEFEMKGKEL